MTLPFRSVWVVGLGTVGSVLAGVLARNGYRVIGIEKDAGSLWRGRELVRAVAGGVTVECTVDIAHAPAADLVIEAVPEDMEVKVGVLRRAHELCGPDTVFVTTTTGLPVTGIAARSGRMTRTVGLHLSDPRHALAGGAVEVVGPPVTDRSVRADVEALVRGIDRVPVTVADRPGFIGGRLLLAYLNRAAAAYETGFASRDDIDAAMTLGCGLPMGPLAHLDHMGIDVAHDSLTALHERTGDPVYAPTPILTRMVASGLLGRKADRGFYRDDHDDWPGPDQRVAAPRPVETIGLVGAGTMATGIAEVCARAGLPTILVARSELRAKEARAAFEASLFRAVRRDKLTSVAADETISRLTTTTRLADLGGCDLVIEAVAEDRTAKREVFEQLDRTARPGATLATTTSSLSVLDCALATSRPQDVIGMHFFNPAPVMKLVEVARTFLTGDDVVATAHTLCATLGKATVSCGDRTGFIVNYLLFPYLNQAVGMLADLHVSPAEVDSVMRDGCGYPLGPFQLLDLIGLDVSLAIQQRLRETFGDPALAPARPLADLAAAGYLGRKTGRGFHVYAEQR